MASQKEMLLKVGADIRDLKAKMKQVKKSTGGLGSAFKKLGPLIGGAFAVGKITQFASESVKLADQQLKAEAALRTAVQGNVKAFNELLNVAREQQKLTLFGDEETAQAQALAQGILQNVDAVKRLTPLAQDLATAKGLNLKNAFELVAKSVASGTNALSRYGIEISGAAGSNERLQSAVDAVTTAFGGQAQAAAKAGLGPLQQLKNSWGDIREELGMLLLPIINKVATALSEFLPKVSDWIKTAKTQVINLANGFIDLYNNSIGFRAVVESISFVFQTAVDKIITTVKALFEVFKSLGNVIVAVFDPRKSVKDAVTQGFETIGNLYKDFGLRTAERFNEGVTSVIAGQLPKILISEETKAEVISQSTQLGTAMGTSISSAMKTAMAPMNGQGMLSGGGVQSGMALPDTLNPGEATGEMVPMAEEAGNAFSALGQQISTAFNEGANSAKSFAQTVKESIKGIIKGLIAQGVAALIANTFKGATGLLGLAAIPIAAAAGAAAQALFGALIPSFAKGGLVSAPTLAMVGDNPGSAFDPEVIAPLSKLRGMGIGGGQLVARVAGEDLLFVVEEAQRRKTGTL